MTSCAFYAARSRDGHFRYVSAITVLIFNGSHLSSQTLTYTTRKKFTRYAFEFTRFSGARAAKSEIFSPPYPGPFFEYFKCFQLLDRSMLLISLIFFNRLKIFIFRYNENNIVYNVIFEIRPFS